MTKKYHIYIIGFIFLLILFPSGILQSHLKGNPQVFLLVLSILTLLAFYSEYHKISTFLFYILLFVVLYMSYFVLIDWVMHQLDPPNKFEKRRPSMDLSGLVYGFFAIFPALISVILYHKTNQRNKILEKFFLFFYSVLTFLLFLINELL